MIAQRIDRLSRGAHAFHRFAHHPLCGEYAPEVLRVGRRTRLCRGCTFAVAGVIAGVVLAASIAPDPSAAAAVLPLAWIFSAKGIRRAGKLATRFLPSGLLAFAIAAGLRAATWTGLVLALFGLGLGYLAVARYRRRGPDRSPCASCPERTQAEPCSGYAEIVRRERAFGRMAGAWLRGS